MRKSEEMDLVEFIMKASTRLQVELSHRNAEKYQDQLLVTIENLEKLSKFYEVIEPIPAIPYKKAREWIAD